MRIRRAVAPLAAMMAMVLLGACQGSAPAPTSPPASTATPSPTATGNGIDRLSAADILAKSAAALDAAASFRMKISARLGLVTSVIDVVFLGSDAKGSQSAMGQSVEFVRVGRYLYVKGTDGYWSTKVGLQEIARYSGKWVKVDATNETHGGLVPSFDTHLSPNDETKAGTTTIDGTPAITIKDGAGNVIHIATKGEPYPLRVEAVQTTDAGQANIVIDFSEFGTVAETIAPPTGEIVDISTA